MWMKHVYWRRRSSKYKWNTGASWKVKTPKAISLSEWRSRWLKHEMRSIKCGWNEVWGRRWWRKRMKKKQQCDNVSFPAESVVKKRKENTEENGTTSPLHHTHQACDYHTGGHPNCLTVYIVKKLWGKTKSSICGAELKQTMVPPNLHAIHAKLCVYHTGGHPITLPYVQWKSCRGRN